MSQTAMFSRTGSTDFPDYLKCMITGPPKSGKTSLLGTVTDDQGQPEILVLDTEPHANNLQSIAHLDVPFKAIHSTDELRQTHFILSQSQFRKQAAEALGIPDIKAVAIDTVDTLQGILKKERMRDKRTTDFLRDDWGWLKEEMTALLGAYLSLDMHVFLLVHTKTKDIGTEKRPETIVLPGLEGAIAESIAGMVGYSLLSFREQQPQPDGTTKTVYRLRAEGNDTYQYLGNRAAGRLPDVIEPDFKQLLAAAMANRPTAKHDPVPVELTGVGTTGQLPQGQPPQPPQQQGLAQNQSQQQPPPQQAPQPPAPQQAQQPPAQQQQGQSQGLPADDQPVNPAALTHVKKVYDTLSLPFPEAKIQALNLGQARGIVRLFKAIEADVAAGKSQNPREEMISYLKGENLMPDENAPAEKKVEAKPDGTIEEVKAWVAKAENEAEALTRANQAFEAERTGKNRKSLMDWLESKGARHGGAAPQEQAPQQAEQVQTPVQNQPAEQPPAPDEQAPPTPPEQPASETPAPVTPEAPAADAPSTEVGLVQSGLGGVVIGEEIDPNAPCEVCGGKIDDPELARLGLSRFKKLMCVNDYILETKKDRA